jgi:hypothetical protein
MSFSQAVGATLSQFRWEQRQVLKQMAQFYQEHGGGDKFLAIRNATKEYKVLRLEVNSQLSSAEDQFLTRLVDLAHSHPDQSDQSNILKKNLIDYAQEYEEKKVELKEAIQALSVGFGATEEERAAAREEIAQEFRQVQSEFLGKVAEIAEGKVPEQYQRQEEQQEIQHQTDQTDEGHEQQKNQEVEQHEQMEQQQEQQEKEKEQEWELELSLG